ncbi:MAG TPA: hypothetical protein VHO92_09695 [Methanobacterium sp.]|nr:hypothetical protein [Methanobacterium sp.]
MKVEIITMAFLQGDPVTYDSKDEGIDQILVEDGKIRIDFVDNGRKWAKEISISSLRFFEYPMDTVDYRNGYKV